MKQFIILLVWALAFMCNVRAQDLTSVSKEGQPSYLGVNIGAAAEAYFPLTKRDYVYETQYVKLQYQRLLWNRNKWHIQLLVEPGYYRARHKLTNIFFIKPGDAPNVQELRDKFSQSRDFYEVALNIGLKFSLKTNSNWKPYGLLSSGPMISSIESEHLDKGFAFSDVLALGTQYQISQNVRLDLRYALRHNSSAGINSPNFGHNSGGLETGISFSLN
ncbi:MAG: acyloxyacyl hydrolase [Nonlabens sp.]|nr:acyloxyacyl hydrolase [Nonlabens sp.]